MIDPTTPLKSQRQNSRDVKGEEMREEYRFWIKDFAGRIASGTEWVRPPMFHEDIGETAARYAEQVAERIYYMGRDGRELGDWELSPNGLVPAEAVWPLYIQVEIKGITSPWIRVEYRMVPEFVGSVERLQYRGAGYHFAKGEE